MIKDENWELTERIIGCAMKVSNTLGCGFLEKVYENALVYELRKQGFEAVPQKPITVYYDGKPVGYYNADILVENKVIVELKAVKEFDKSHHIQLLNYLKASRLKSGLLFNFGNPKLDYKRKSWTGKIEYDNDGVPH
jgi:GxxExxY protein